MVVIASRIDICPNVFSRQAAILLFLEHLTNIVSGAVAKACQTKHLHFEIRTGCFFWMKVKKSLESQTYKGTWYNDDLWPRIVVKK